MIADWQEVHDEMHHARWVLAPGRVIGLQVESLMENGWDWHVWDSLGVLDPRYGLASSLDAAKARAEAALDVMLARSSKPRAMVRSDDVRF